MENKLVLAAVRDAETIHKLMVMAFMPLYEKYHDDKTSPAKESVEKVINQLKEDFTDYYLIKNGDTNIGAVRVVKSESKVFRISPLFILPEYQNQGVGSEVINELFGLYEHAVAWRLDTILQEEENCHLYGKCGFVRTERRTEINERMTIVGYEKCNVTVRKFVDSDAEAVV